MISRSVIIPFMLAESRILSTERNNGDTHLALLAQGSSEHTMVGSDPTPEGIRTGPPHSLLFLCLGECLLCPVMG